MGGVSLFCLRYGFDAPTPDEFSRASLSLNGLFADADTGLADSILLLNFNDEG